MITIQLRRGTTTDWSTANPVLALGEIGLNTTTNNFRVGDGSTQWSSLTDWITGGSSSAASTISTISSATNATFYPTFVANNNGTAAQESVYTDASLVYNPSTNVLSTGDISVNGGDLLTNQTTFNLINTTATTLSIGGAATTLNIGGIATSTAINHNYSNGFTGTGTLTANIASSNISTGTRNINIGTGTITSAAQTISIGTGAAGGSTPTHAINIGSSTSTTTISGSLVLGTILPSTYGGTGNGFTKFSGPATSEKTFTLPNASSTILTDNAAVTLAQGGTNASLTASNGGIVYSTGSALAILSGNATAGKMLQSGASTTPSWSTATFPSTAATSGTILRANGTNWVTSTSTFADTYAVNTLLYAGTANTVSGLATANNGVLVTSGTGIPSISTTLPSSLTITTPTIDTINTSLTTTGTAALFNTGITTGTISIGGALTTGTINIASGTAGAKTLNIGTSTGTTNINGTVVLSSALAYNYGGTGLTSYAKGDILYASAINTLAKLAVPATNGYVLTYNSTTALPEWAAAASGSLGYIGNYQTTSTAATAGSTVTVPLSSTLGLSGGSWIINAGASTNSNGTGGSITLNGGAALATGGVSTGGNVSVLGGNATAGSGQGGSVTINGGSGGALGDITIGTSNTNSLTLGAGGKTTTINGTLSLGTALPVASGGTGQTTYTNGQLLIGNTTGNTLTKATLTQGGATTITNGAGSITISSSDTNFYPNAVTFTNGTTSGPTVTLAMTASGGTDVTSGAFPAANLSQSGVVTTGAQNFAGTKTFKTSTVTDGISIAGNGTGTGTLAVLLTPASLTSSRTATFPDTSGTVAFIDAAQTFTATQTFSNTISANNATTAIDSTAATLTIQPVSQSSTNGRAVAIIGGSNSQSTGGPVGGSISINGGAQTNALATGTGGSVSINGGTSGANGTGGDVNIRGGIGGGNGNGNVNIGTTSATAAVNIGASGAATVNIQNPLLTAVSVIGAGGAEGGQVNFARVTDGTGYWHIDSYGTSATPSLRFIENATTQLTLATGGVATFAGAAKLRSGGTAADSAPLYLGTSTNLLSSTAAGAMEFNNKALWFTPSTTPGRALVATPFYNMISTDNTSLINVSPGVPTTYSAFGTNGIALETAVAYEVEMLLLMSATASSNSSTLIITPGSPTGAAAPSSSQFYWDYSASTTVMTNAAATSSVLRTGTTTFPSLNTITIATGTTQYVKAFVKGIVRVATAGNFTMRLAFTPTSPGTVTGTIYAGSYLKVTPLGTENTTTVGTWA